LDAHPELKTILLENRPGGRPPIWEVTDKQFAHVAHCRALRRLEAGEMDSTTRLNDDALKSLEGLRDLRTLDLYGGVVSDSGLAHLSGLTSLEELRLDGNDRIGDETLGALKGLKNLRVLMFYRAKVTDAGLAAI